MRTGIPVTDCVFCGRIQHGQFDQSDDHAVSFAPLNPVTPGHLLVVPRVHVPDALAEPEVTADTMLLAAELAAQRGQHCNIITSAGRWATQTVRHLHIHIVPRHEHDGLRLPWT